MSSRVRQAVADFKEELYTVVETPPPISKLKMNVTTKSALRAVKMYKHVIMFVEKFIEKCPTQYKLCGLYVIDSIVRHSRHQYGPEQDVFGPRFLKNLCGTFIQLLKGAPTETEKMRKVLMLWEKNSVFPLPVVECLFKLVESPTDASVIGNCQATARQQHQLTKPVLAGPSRRTPGGGSNGPRNFLEAEAQELINIVNEIGPSTPASIMNDKDHVRHSCDKFMNILTKYYNRVPPEHDFIDGLRQCLNNFWDIISATSNGAEPRNEPYLIPEHIRKEIQKLVNVLLMEAREKGPDANGAPSNFGVQAPNERGRTRHAPIRSGSVGRPGNSRSPPDWRQGSGAPTRRRSRPSGSSRPRHYSRSPHSRTRHYSRSPRGWSPRDRSRSRSPWGPSSSRRRFPESRHPTAASGIRSRSRSLDRLRERKKYGLPPLLAKSLCVCSTTIWVGHLPKHTGEGEFRAEVERFGEVLSVNLIPPRGCAYVCFAERKSALSCLTSLRGTRIAGSVCKTDWAPGLGIKAPRLKDLWNAQNGCTYLPWDQMPNDMDGLLDLEAGGFIDPESLPEIMRNDFLIGREKRMEDACRRPASDDDDDEATRDSAGPPDHFEPFPTPTSTASTPIPAVSLGGRQSLGPTTANPGVQAITQPTLAQQNQPQQTLLQPAVGPAMGVPAQPPQLPQQPQMPTLATGLQPQLPQVAQDHGMTEPVVSLAPAHPIMSSAAPMTMLGLPGQPIQAAPGSIALSGMGAAAAGQMVRAPVTSLGTPGAITALPSHLTLSAAHQIAASHQLAAVPRLMLPQAQGFQQGLFRLPVAQNPLAALQAHALQQQQTQAALQQAALHQQQVLQAAALQQALQRGAMANLVRPFGAPAASVIRPPTPSSGGLPPGVTVEVAPPPTSSSASATPTATPAAPASTTHEDDPNVVIQAGPALLNKSVVSSSDGTDAQPSTTSPGQQATPVSAPTTVMTTLPSVPKDPLQIQSQLPIISVAPPVPVAAPTGVVTSALANSNPATTTPAAKESSTTPPLETPTEASAGQS